MLTVHHLQRSQSERIPWLCEELGVEYDLKIYKRKPFFSPPELAALTTLGAAPVITDTTFNPDHPLTLAESAAIAEYIVHKHGGGRLILPPSHEGYVDYLYWFHVSNGNLQPVFVRSMQFKRLGLEADHPAQKNADNRLDLMLKLFNDRLESVTWLAGDEFTLADIMSVFTFSTMRVFSPLDLTGYNGILAWLKRVGERPAYRRAMEKGDPGFVPALEAESPPLFTGNH